MAGTLERSVEEEVATHSGGITLAFDRGTLVIRGADPALAAVLPEARPDPRIGAIRLPAHHYHRAVRALVARKLTFNDDAKAYRELDLSAGGPTPRDYQTSALTAWIANARRGVVVLPTGSGKTQVAAMAIHDTGRSTLVVVPTLDLVNQWYDGLAERFGDDLVGVVGGGSFVVNELTVITYDSAYLHLERLGDRFGLLICDEAHHLPGPNYVQSAQMSLAPFRLGLTATPPDEPERQALLERAIGPTVFEQGITDLAGEFLSSYDVIRIRVAMDAAEREAYQAAHALYRGFVESRGLRLGGRNGWGRFLQATSQSEEGRAAFAAWREQRRIAMAAPAKLAHLEEILARHKDDRMIVFTHGNEFAYEVSRRFLVPAITHQTRPTERRAILNGLRDGSVPVVVTSRVLNEGVDVPSVNVGVILSGSATVREHVQRLGRILRKVEGKHALLYEVVTEDTSEEAASQRRRAHDAYR